MKRQNQDIDFSYRPGPWLRTVACVGLATLLTTGVTARGRQETTADPDATRTPISVDQHAGNGTGNSPEPLVAEIDRPAWAMVFHPALSTLQEEVNDTISNGYTPAGMDVGADGSVTMLYRVAGEDQPRQWLLEDYTAETINTEISARLLQGWTPSAFSTVGATFFVLYRPGAGEIAEWRIHQTPFDTEAIPGIIEAYRDNGFDLVDFSIDPETDEVWYLFVKSDSDDPAGASLFVNAYPNGEATAAGISVDYQAGRGMPDGIASTEEISLVFFRSIR